MNQSDIDSFTKFFKRIGRESRGTIFYKDAKYSRNSIAYDIETSYVNSSHYSWYSECDIRNHINLKKSTENNLLNLLNKHNSKFKSLYIRSKKLDKVK